MRKMSKAKNDKFSFEHLTVSLKTTHLLVFYGISTNPIKKKKNLPEKKVLDLFYRTTKKNIRLMILVLNSRGAKASFKIKY